MVCVDESTRHSYSTQSTTLQIKSRGNSEIVREGRTETESIDWLLLVEDIGNCYAPY